MIRGVFVLALAGCSRSSPPPAPIANATAPRADAGVVVEVEQPRPADVPSAPPPAPPVDAGASPVGPTCPTGAGVQARVIRVAVEGAYVIVTVGAGANRGVTKRWTVVRVQPSPVCELLRIDHHVTSLRCAGTFDQIKAVPVVVLCPPP